VRFPDKVTTHFFVRTLKSLGLGVLLIALAAAVLLYSDLGSRRGAGRGVEASARVLRVALVQHASLPALDDGVRGVLEALQARGYVNGGRLEIRQYNAHGDMPTSNAIAKEVTSSDYDLIISASTASLQTIANANRFATPPRKHVFGMTSDPYGAGVGVSRENHADHPPYMTGLGSLAPVAEAFRLARQLNPQLKRVGLVWNPAEANSVATTELGRKVCAELGIQLVEANAENATAAGEAAASVLSRNIDALWVSPDVTVVTAIDVLLAAAKRARVPVFTSLPGYAEKGALFDLGADFVAIGRVQGDLAADVLDGRDPAARDTAARMLREL
jgi:putative ABC transport system substrate-binding protein